MFARHGRGQEPDREGTARDASFRLFGEDLGQWTSREHKFAFDELFIVHRPCNTQREMDYFGKAPAGPKNGQCGWLKYGYVRAMIYAGQRSVKRRKASVAGIGMVL